MHDCLLDWIKVWGPVIGLLYAPERLTGRYNISEGAYCDIVVQVPEVHHFSRWYRGGNSIINMITFYRLHTTIKCAVSYLKFK